MVIELGTKYMAALYHSSIAPRVIDLPSSEDCERLTQLIRDNRLSEAYNQLKALVGGPGKPALSSEVLAIICSLVKALSQANNFKTADDLLDHTLKLVTPKDDHFFLTLADELVSLSEFNPLSKHENSTRHDKLFDQALRIRKDLVGADIVAAELIIDSIFANLQKARQAAAAALTAEAAGRLTRCRTLMGELNGLMEHLSHPPDLLIARVNTMKSFFEQSAGQKNSAKAAYMIALEAFAGAQERGTLERSDIFEMFLEQSQLYQFTAEQKAQVEKLKKSKLTIKRLPTQFKIKAFPTVDHIQDIMQRAASRPGKTFNLTSLGFLGSQSLSVSVVCHKDSGDMTVTIDPVATDKHKAEKIVIDTVDAHEVLRHIKDLWRQLQGKPTSGGAVGSPLMQPDFTISSRQASWEDMKDSGGFFTSPLYKKDTADLLGQQKPPAPSNIFESTASASFNKLPEQGQSEANNAGTIGKSEFEITPADPRRSQNNMETKPDLGPDKHKVSGPVGYAAHAEEQHRQTLIFEGNLKTMPSLGLLQTISLNNNTGVLEVSGKDGMISIYFDNGKPVHAASIKDTGIEILYDFVMQEEGWFRFLPERRASMVSLKVRLDTFLLDAASLFDENKYLKSLGLTMYSGLFAREFCSDKAEFEEMVKERGVEMEPEMWDLYISLLENPIVSDAVELADLPKRQWLHALYKLVQTGMVSISNDGMDDEDLATRLVTKWSYNKKKSDEFAASLSDSRTGLLRFEFLIWLIEREFERARTQMWPLSIIIIEIRRNGKLPADLSLEDRELIHSTLAQIAEAKRSIDWFGHFEDDHYAVLTPGLDSNLAGMFAQNFADICSRSLGKLKEGQSDWDYSFGIASLPGDTFEWQKMVGFAIEAQRRARVSRKGFETHAGIKAADAIKAELNKAGKPDKSDANKDNLEARQSHSNLSQH